MNIHLSRKHGLGFLITIVGMALISGCGAADADPDTAENSVQPVSDALIGCSAESPESLVVSAYDKVLNHYDLATLDSVFAKDFIQHNPTVPDGRAGLAAFVAFRKAQQPEAHNQIVRVTAQGDLVALQVHVTATIAERNDEHAGTAIVDIFRVDHGKIVEHWDVIQPVPATSVNGHTMFDGGGKYPENARSSRRLSERNAALVVAAYDTVLNDFDTAPLQTAFGASFVQHNPTFPDGVDTLAGFAAFRKSQQPEAHNEIVRVVAEGDLVMLQVHVTNTLAERSDEHAGTAIVDIFRVQDDKIVEHWDVIEQVPATSVNGHTMFDGGGKLRGANK